MISNVNKNSISELKNAFLLNLDLKSLANPVY